MDLHEELNIPPPKAFSEGGSLPDYDQVYYLTEEMKERSIKNQEI